MTAPRTMKKTIVGGMLFGAALTAGALIGPGTANAITEIFLPCGGGAGVATTVTSCGFAQNVRAAYFTQPGPVVTAWSPAMNRYYDMQCQAGFVATFSNGMSVNSARCVGGDNAVVVVW
jgi:hypothetical protein